MNKSRNRMRTLLLASAAVSYGMSAPGLMAQDADDDGDFALEEIIVTSQKREVTLQDVPVAVSAISGDVLAKTNTRDIRDLQFVVPALNTTQSAAAFQTVVNIRGIGTSGFNPGLEPSVGIYVDGVYRSRTGSAIGDFVSVERVEVLRGPQSTLFGKNTSAGVISFVTQKPDLVEAGGKFEVTYGNYDQFIAKGTFTAPIVDDVLGVRISANINQRDGFIRNVFNGEDVNDRDRFALRGQLLYEPSDALSIRIIGDYSEIDEACCAAPFTVNGPTAAVRAAIGGTVLPIVPFNREVSFDGDLLSSMKDKGISMEVNYDFENVEFTSITAYRDFTSDASIDADFTDLDIVKRNGEFTDIQVFTQEFRLASTGNNRVDWLVGGFYSNQDLLAIDEVPFGADTRNFFSILSGFGAFGPVDNVTGVELTLASLAAGGLWAGPVPALGSSFAEGTGQVDETFTTQSESWALFGQFDFHINDRLTLTGGLRYTKENKQAQGVFDINDSFAAIDFEEMFVSLAIAGQLGALPPGTPPAVIQAVIDGTRAAVDPIKGDPAFNTLLGFQALQLFPALEDFDRSRTEDKWTGNIILAYDISDDVNAYASVSRGYKAGGFDTSRAASSNDPNDTNTFEFSPETVDAIEIGFKTRFWENRAQVNVAFFTQEVKDFQANLFNGLGFELRNAGSIRIKGVEVDANFALTENLLWSFAAAYNDAEFTSFPGGPCTFDDPASVCDLTGERPADVPKLTTSSSLSYEHEINENLSSAWQLGMYSRSGRSIAGDNDPNGFQGGNFILNASVALYDPENSWRVNLWVKNLTKENYNQIVFDSVAQAGSFSAYPSDPRTYGATVSFEF